SVSGHAGWAAQRAVQVPSMSALELPGLQKKITKRFVNTSLGEVLAWLSLEQFSFVADAGEFPGKGQVTLSFRDQPLGAVLDAIADAFNGRWEQRGEIFTLRPRDAFRGSVGVAELTAPTIALPGQATTATAPSLAPMRTPGVRNATAPATARSQSPTFRFDPLPTIPPSSGATRAAAPLRSSEAQIAPGVARVLPPGAVRTTEVPAITRAVEAPLTVTRPDLFRQGALAVPTLPPIASVTTPLYRQGVAVAGQSPQDRQEAIRAAEAAMRKAEEAIRKLHESGEWQKAMEKAMSQARSQQNSDEMRKAMEEVRRAMQNMSRSDEWRKAWEEARAAMRKALQEGKVVKDGKERPMTDKEKQAVAKALDSMKDFQMPKFDFVMPKIDEKAFVMPKIDQKAFVMPPMKLDESFMKEHKLQMEKLMKELPKMEGKAFVMPPMKLDKEFMKEHNLQMEKLMKELPKMEGKAFVMPPMKLDKEFMKEHELQMEKLMKELPKMEGKAFVMPPMKLDKEFMKEHKLQMEKLMKELPKMEGKAFVMPKIENLPQGRAFTFDSKRMQINELLSSLTPAQKEKQAKQGYLTIHDLTPKQREMLGNIPTSGDWTFSYSIDGKKLTIKSK
ncbi:MAG TPA: hypothetical protein PLX06_03560, partial [Fimbriimonadaceae bacterium]|nr:hypothetical protein [Fimbriimonadaceae bacterium]